MSTPNTIAAPVAPAERIQALDILRGIAVMGILIMNIQSYSMISAAYMNPTAYGDLTGLNKLVWVLSDIFANMKFWSIFSILFGAGIVLFTSKVEEKGVKSAALHYRRSFWLLVIGLIHAYLFWHGDILVTYALCALFIYLFRKLSSKKLLITGLILFIVPFTLYLFFGWSMRFWPEEAINGQMAWWQPAQEVISKEIATYKGTFFEQMSHRIPYSLMFQTFIFLIYAGWRAAGLMLIGMALFKWDFLTARRSNRLYFIVLLCGFAIGFPLIIYGQSRNFAEGWRLTYSMFIGSQFNYCGSLFVALGYISVIMLAAKASALKKILKPFAAVGRTAFSNYLGQTLICTTLFYGHGFALFGDVERRTQILIVFAIWVVQLIVSPLWLRFFRFGPFEWLWRSLTYMKLQPFLVRASSK